MYSDKAPRFLSFLNGDVSEVERRCGAGFDRFKLVVDSVCIAKTGFAHRHAFGAAVSSNKEL